jgi:hypothetical protein
MGYSAVLSCLYNHPQANTLRKGDEVNIHKVLIPLRKYEYIIYLVVINTFQSLCLLFSCDCFTHGRGN